MGRTFVEPTPPAGYHIYVNKIPAWGVFPKRLDDAYLHGRYSTDGKSHLVFISDDGNRMQTWCGKVKDRWASDNWIDVPNQFVDEDMCTACTAVAFPKPKQTFPRQERKRRRKAA